VSSWCWSIELGVFRRRFCGRGRAQHTHEPVSPDGSRPRALVVLPDPKSRFSAQITRVKSEVFTIIEEVKTTVFPFGQGVVEDTCARRQLGGWSDCTIFVYYMHSHGA
jgi:hypothetical protein